MATLLNMNINSKCYQLNTANTPDSQAGLEPVQQSRCYLCDIPKQDYSLTKAFSELICRGCLNYEGPDRIEQLIAEAYQIKRRQASPAFNATPQLVGNGNNIHKTQMTRFGNGSNSSDLAHLRDVQAFAHNQPAKQIALPPLDGGLAHCVTNGIEVGLRAAASDGLIPSTAANRTGKERCLQKSERSLSDSPTHSSVWENQIVASESQGRLSARTSLPTTTWEARPTIAPTATPTLKSLRFKPNTAADCVAVNQIKNQMKNSRFLCQSKQSERYASDTSAQVASNQEGSNKQLGRQTSSPSTPLESLSLSQTLIEKTTHPAKGPNEREAENQPQKEKVAQAKQSPPGSMNYAMQQQQQQMLAVYDPMHMVRTPACGAADHIMRLHQQHFPALSNTNLEREVARLQGGPSAGDGARRAHQLATLPDCSRTADTLQRFIQDPNAALSLPFYAASSMSCGGAAYFVQPPPQQQLQSIHSAGSLGSGAVNRVKQNTPAPPSSLYDAPYSYAMAPYMASNGALFCPSQYHPYHYHPHPSAFQSAAAYGSILSSAASCMTNSQCFTPQANGFNGLVGSLEKSSSCAGGSLATASGGSKLEHRLLGVPDSNPFMSNGAEPQCVGLLSAKEKQTTRKPVASPERTAHKSNEHEGDQNWGPEVDAQRKRDRNTDSVKESENSRTSNTLSILERDRESLAGDDGEQQDQQQVQTARDKQSTSMLNGTGSTNASPTKSRSDLHYRLSTSNSPPPSKRPAIGFSRTSKSLAKGDLGNGLATDHTPPPPQPLVPPSHSLVACANMSKTKPQTSANKQQPISRRSQAPASSERSSTTDMTNKMKHNNVPAAGQDGDGLRQLRKAIDGDDFPRAGHELVARTGPMHNTNSAASNTNSTPFHNENSSDRNFGALSSDPATPVSISSTTGLASRMAPPVGQDPKQGQQAQQAQQQMQTPPHKYSPLKCLSCQERLEDRHFVQCPSVMAHKFCFACSKKSIERQQSENKNLGGGFERVFCPSGRRCFLATEQTPWTFMNSEIETIFRESSRVSSSSSSVALAEAPSSRVNSSASSSPIKSKHNQARAGDEFEVCDKRSSSRLPPAQSKHDDTTDSGSQKVGSMPTQKANKVN